MTSSRNGMEDAPDDTQVRKLTYMIAEQKSVMVISLVGALNKEANSVIEECMAQVMKKDGVAYVILNFRDVAPTTERTTFPALTRLQKLIRDKGATLKVSGLHPELGSTMEEYGVIRGNEVVGNVAEALQSLALIQG